MGQGPFSKDSTYSSGDESGSSSDERESESGASEGSASDEPRRLSLCCGPGSSSRSSFKRSESFKTRMQPRETGHWKALLVEDKSKKLTDVFEVKLDGGSAIGEGGYASVFVGKERSSGDQRAIKRMQKDMIASRSRLQLEIDLLMSMDHPHINKLYQVFEDRLYIYLVLELCSGGELFDRIREEGHFSERGAAIVMRQILLAVSYMHKNGVAHRDLKPENFLFQHREPIEGNTLKVIDFGIAARFDPGTEPFRERTGTPYYVAPEVLPSSSSTSYGCQCDLWSCGVVMYVLLSGRLPFRGVDDDETFYKVRRGKFSFPADVFGKVSEDAKNLVKRMLTVNTKKRISAEAALNDIWIRDFAPSAAPAPLLDSVVEAISQFAVASKFKRTALHVVARQIDDSQIDQLKNIFMELDENGDGHLTAAELHEGLRRANLGQHLPQDLSALLANLDTDGSGEIDYTEFLAASIERSKYDSEKLCRAAFRVFDKNDDGLISPKELAEALATQDVASIVGKDHVDKLIAEVDDNNDGFVDFEEFMAMMRRP